MSRCTGPTLNSCMRRRDSLPSCVSRSRASSFSLRVPCLCMCACLRLRAPLLPACVPCAYVSWCVCACVPGESVAGQCVPPDPGHAGGGDADDRQPLRLCLPPLLVSAHLQRLQGPPARGTPPPPQHYHEGPRTELQISSLSHCRCFRSVRKCELTTASKASTTVFILHFIPCVPTESTLLSTEHRSGRQACRFARALMDVHTLRASFIA